MRASVLIAAGAGNVALAQFTNTTTVVTTPSSTATSATTSSTGLTTAGFPSTIGDYQFYGCTTSRTGFPGFRLQGSSSTNSIDFCAASCPGRFFGVFNTDCYCGDNVNTNDITRVGNTQCNTRCPGNDAEFCGGVLGARISRRQIQGPVPLSVALTFYIRINNNNGGNVITTTTGGSTITTTTGGITAPPTTVTTTVTTTATNTVTVCRPGQKDCRPGQLTTEVFTYTKTYCPTCAHPTGYPHHGKEYDDWRKKKIICYGDYCEHYDEEDYHYEDDYKCKYEDNRCQEEFHKEKDYCDSKDKDCINKWHKEHEKEHKGKNGDKKHRVICDDDYCHTEECEEGDEYNRLVVKEGEKYKYSKCDKEQCNKKVVCYEDKCEKQECYENECKEKVKELEVKVPVKDNEEVRAPKPAPKPEPAPKPQPAPPGPATPAGPAPVDINIVNNNANSNANNNVNNLGGGAAGSGGNAQGQANAKADAGSSGSNGGEGSGPGKAGGSGVDIENNNANSNANNNVNNLGGGSASGSAGASSDAGGQGGAQAGANAGGSASGGGDYSPPKTGNGTTPVVGASGKTSPAGVVSLLGALAGLAYLL